VQKSWSRFRSATRIAVLLMGGSGTRFGGSLPKQYVEMAGKPLFFHALEVFQKAKEVQAIVLVVPRGMKGKTKTLLSSSFPKVKAIILGGSCREESTRNAVLYLSKSGVGPYSLVMIHDADRPLIEPEYITLGYSAAEADLSSVTAVPCTDSLAYSAHSNSLDHYGDRRGNYLLQTPQTIAFSPLLKALEKNKDNLSSFTDDASLVLSSYGIKPRIILGKRTNFKINTPEDCLLFEEIIKGRNL